MKQYIKQLSMRMDKMTHLLRYDVVYAASVEKGLKQPRPSAMKKIDYFHLTTFPTQYHYRFLIPC